MLRKLLRVMANDPRNCGASSAGYQIHVERKVPVVVGANETNYRLLLPSFLARDLEKLEVLLPSVERGTGYGTPDRDSVRLQFERFQNNLVGLGRLTGEQVTAVALGLYRLVGLSEPIGFSRRFVLSHKHSLSKTLGVIADSAKDAGVDWPMHGALLALASLLAGVGDLNGPLIETALKYCPDDDDDFDPVRLVERYLRESTACGYKHSSNGTNPYNEWKIQDLPSGRNILALTQEQQVEILMETLKWGFGGGSLSPGASSSVWRDRTCFHMRYSDLVTRLLRRNLPLSESQIIELLGHWQLSGVIQTAEKFVEANGLGDNLRAVFEEILPKLNFTSGHVKIRTRIERMLREPGERLVINGESVLKNALSDWLASRQDSEKKAWAKFFEHALATEGSAQPSAKWLSAAAEYVADIGEDRFVERLASWAFDPGLSKTGREPAGDILKAMVWAAARTMDEGLAPLFGSLCESAYRKIPGMGPGSIPVGNACIHALAVLPGEGAAAELVRLKSRVKFSQGKKRLDEALEAAAERTGLTVIDLEEITLPTFGLDADGSRETVLGDVTAKIRIVRSDEVTLTWFGADGKARKSVPASVKANHADELRALRTEVKEIKGLLAGHRWRLEKLYLAERSLLLADWHARYLEHPLMANMAQRLIWNFNGVAAVPVEDGFSGRNGRPFDPPADATVSLWHPIQAGVKEVLGWRRRLAKLEIVQPFKQAHREVYLLTDAERAARSYSNRFAAHYLYQAQMNALMSARGWTHRTIGWDQTQFMPRLELPNGGGAAVFGLGRVDSGHTPSGADLHVASQRVRFEDDNGRAIDLETIAPIIFSEVMRDVDLFVGVSSVGNNPEWQDGGPEGQFHDYWWRYNTAALAESARTRRAVLEDLLPKLKISDVCELDGPFLKVRGTKRTYKIHLGSGNILMEPNDQYLCIVQDVRGLSEGGDRIRLPFEGDRTLSLILSKAFLLAADDKITDRTILGQIGA